TSTLALSLHDALPICMPATVALDEMQAVPEFDKICQGPGEKVIVDLVRNPDDFPRVVQGVGASSMAEWPMIDRTLWPKPASRRRSEEHTSELQSRENL